MVPVLVLVAGSKWCTLSIKKYLNHILGVYIKNKLKKLRIKLVRCWQVVHG
jgi:hypothetical protein